MGLRALLAAALLLVLLMPAPGLADGALDDMRGYMAQGALRAGRSAMEHGDFKLAIARYTEAIESGRLGPENLSIAYNNRGNACSAAGDSAHSIQDYNQALAINPNFTQAYFNRGIEWYRRQKYKESLADFNQAAALEPQMAGAYFNRSFPLAALGRFDEALADLKKALELEPFNHKYRQQVEIVKAAREKAADKAKKP